MTKLEPLPERMSRLEIITRDNNSRSRTREKFEDEDEFEMGGKEESQNENCGRYDITKGFG